MNLKRDTINRLRWLRSALLIPPLEQESLDKFSERVVREALRQSADEIAIWVNDILSERQSSTDVKILLMQINNKLDKVIMKQDELAAALTQASTDIDAIGAQLGKALDEILAKINELLSGDVSPEVEAGLNAMKTSVETARGASQKLDDVVPDQP